MNLSFHEGYRPGCIGRIAELHACHYHRLADFGLAFESKVARELAAFCEGYVDGRDGLWLALVGGRVEGSIAIDGTHAQRDGAHLRWFIVSDGLRGKGVGSRGMLRGRGGIVALVPGEAAEQVGGHRDAPAMLGGFIARLGGQHMGFGGFPLAAFAGHARGEQADLGALHQRGAAIGCILVGWIGGGR